MNQFPCRTKVVDRVQYVVKIYDAAGDVRLSTSFYDEKDRAEQFVKNMTETVQGAHGKITEHRFSETVCIECGKES